MNRIIPAALLGLYLVVFAVCAINPYDRAVWWAESLPIVLIVAAVAFSWRWHQFSPLADGLGAVFATSLFYLVNRRKIGQLVF